VQEEQQWHHATHRQAVLQILTVPLVIAQVVVVGGVQCQAEADIV